MLSIYRLADGQTDGRQADRYIPQFLIGSGYENMVFCQAVDAEQHSVMRFLKIDLEQSFYTSSNLS